MSSLQRIVITSPLTAVGFKSVCDLAPGQLPALNNLIDYLSSVPDQQAASLEIKVGAVQATGTLTVSGAGSSNGETCLVCNVTLTAKTSGAVAADGEFNISATPATQAASMVTAINTVSTLTGKVTASNLLGVVTLTSVVPGLIGNGLQMSEGLTNVALSAFAGGTDGTAYTLDLD